MGPVANPPDDPADAAELRGHADRLADALDAAVPGWIERLVTTRWSQWRGEAPPPELLTEARAAGAAARAELMPALRTLLATDVDAQRANPLAVLRGAVTHATAVLRSAGVPPVVRDAQATELFPDDDYDLVPGAFGDIDPGLHELGLVWGAAKAHVVLARRRRGGLR